MSNQDILHALWMQAKKPCTSVKIGEIRAVALQNKEAFNSRSNTGITPSGIDYAVLKFILEYTTPVNWTDGLWTQFNEAKDPYSGNYRISQDYPTLLVNILSSKPIKKVQNRKIRDTRSNPISLQSNSISPFNRKPTISHKIPPELSGLYTNFQLLNKGGFARVFKAKRRGDGEFVAVKIPISLDASTGRSFIAEMQNWTKLHHPNIVKVYDFNIMPLPYIEMELCDSSLADMQKPIDIEKAAQILFNICEGLKYTHSRSLVHRDLKPQNILLKNGVPKISDWGLSRILSESTTLSLIHI